MIAKCECKHRQQDKLHGEGNRVFNKTAKGDAGSKFEHRCTVCGNVKKM